LLSVALNFLIGLVRYRPALAGFCSRGESLWMPPAHLQDTLSARQTPRFRPIEYIWNLTGIIFSFNGSCKYTFEIISNEPDNISWRIYTMSISMKHWQRIINNHKSVGDFMSRFQEGIDEAYWPSPLRYEGLQSAHRFKITLTILEPMDLLKWAQGDQVPSAPVVIESAPIIQSSSER
jgi:hypothetical protein